MKKISPYEVLGKMHGTCFFYEKDNPDDFLAMMENKMKPENFSIYMDGFIEGREGLHTRKFRFARAFADKGAQEWKTDEL